MLVLCVALTGCEKAPTLADKFAPMKGGLETLVAKIKDVQAQLKSAPAVTGKFTLPADIELRAYPSDKGPANTVIVAEDDVTNWEGDVRAISPHTVRATSTVSFVHVRDLLEGGVNLQLKVEEEPRKAKSLDRLAEWSKGIRFVAMVRDAGTKQPLVDAKASRFEPGTWRGEVCLWDLDAKAWLGTVKVTVGDRRKGVAASGYARSAVVSGHVSAIGKYVSRAISEGRNVVGYAK